MRIHGYCTECHKIRRVTVSGYRLEMAMARQQIPMGVCADCQEKKDKR